MNQAFVDSIAFYLPEKILTNEELANLYPEWPAEKIFSKTGILERRIAGKDEFGSDLAVNAAKKLFDEYSVIPEEIDFILLATQSPDYFLPTTACLIQNRLGIPSTCGALDYNLGCSAYIYGLSLAKSIILGEIAKNVLLLTSETYSKYIHPLDKSVRTLFGDGATATMIRGRDVEEGIGQFVLGTDGSGSENLIVPAGAMRYPKNENTGIEFEDESGSVRTKNNLYMNGPEIFNFTIRVVPKLVHQTLEKNNLSFDDINLFIFHQANKYMLDFLQRKLKIPNEKFYVDIKNIGNTVSSSIPIALKLAIQDRKIKKGDKLMLVGFGVGYSWGATVITWK